MPSVPETVQFATFFLSHYALLAVLALFAFLIGWRITNRVPYRSFSEAFVFSTALGLGVIACLIFALGLAGALTPAALLVVFVFACVVARPHRGELQWAAHFLKSIGWRRWVLCAAALILLKPVFLLPLYPPTQPDAVSFHLTLARLYATGHAIEPATFLRYPVFPQLNEMLFTVMLLLQDDVAAQLVQFLMMWLTAIALYAWVGAPSTDGLGSLARCCGCPIRWCCGWARRPMWTSA
jgi:hypothetical protein